MPAMSRAPSSNVSSAFRHRRSVDLPQPDAPSTATRSPTLTSALTPPSVARSPCRLRRFRMLITVETPFEPPGQAREWITHREIERRTKNSGHEPAPEIDCGDRHPLRELDDGNDAD